MLRFMGTAAAVGAGWFAVLWIPSMTREWLRGSPGTNLALLIAASVVVSVVCRRFIAGARTFGKHLLRAVLIPLLGCLVFLALWAAIFLVQGIAAGAPPNLHDAMSLIVLGTTAAVTSWFVVIPYGLFAQVVLHRMGSRGRHTVATPTAD